jgi:hypothetical protein
MCLPFLLLVFPLSISKLRLNLAIHPLALLFPSQKVSRIAASSNSWFQNTCQLFSSRPSLASKIPFLSRSFPLEPFVFGMTTLEVDLDLSLITPRDTIIPRRNSSVCYESRIEIEDL